jgi:antitoxin (DNA-binding transcriptional repressor) of toxin-antitoxin stability system
MKTANVAEFKKHMSAYLEMVEQGETVEICRRNVPIAHLSAVAVKKKNHTVLGCGEGSVTYLADVTEPFIPSNSWEMLGGDHQEDSTGS